jgi:hypothetical protein
VLDTATDTEQPPATESVLAFACVRGTQANQGTAHQPERRHQRRRRSPRIRNEKRLSPTSQVDRTQGTHSS